MRHLLICAAFLFSFITPARGADWLGTDHRIDFSADALWVMPTNTVLRGENPQHRRVTASTPVNLQFSARCLPDTRYGRWYPEARQGVGIGIQPVLPTSVLGCPVLLYVRQSAPFAKLSERLSVEYEWNFGAALGWKSKNHSDADYDRKLDCIGSPFTAYINLGIYARYRLNGRTSIFGGLDLRHYSNGNTADPNPGINMTGLRLGASWLIGEPVKIPTHDWSDFEPGFVVDAVAYGAWRRWAYHPDGDRNNQDNYVMLPGHYGVAGIFVNPLYRFNPVFAVGGAIDANFDSGANLGNYRVPGSPEDKPRFYKVPFSHRYMVGISARGEMRMALFAINVGVGHSIVAPGGSDLRGWYNTFALKTFFTDHFFLHIGYRLVHFTHQGNLMLGAGVRL